MSFFTTIEADLQKAVDWVKGTNWSAAVAYWQEFMTGLESALPVIEKLFPGSVSTVDHIITPLLANANTTVAALATAALSYQAGTLTEGEVLTAAQAVSTAVKAASDMVGGAIKNTIATTNVSAS